MGGGKKYYGNGRYKRVGWIESHGTEWIDTRIIPDQLTNSEIIFFVTRGQTTGRFFGEQTLETNRYLLFISSSVNLAFRYGSQQENVVQNFEYDTQYKVKVGKQIFLNNTLIAEFNNEQISTQNTCLIFKCQAPSEYFTKIRLFSLKMWDNSTLVRNFIPVLDRQTNKAGLYDLVTKTFYGNQGTGDFTWG